MAFFKKNNNSEPTTTVALKGSFSKEAISSIISKEMHIVGEITFKGKAKLDGNLEGNLTGEYLILSETGYIQGDLRLDSLICYGKVIGNIHAKTVTIHSTAIIEGKLTAASLTVEPGALLSGEISAAYKEEKKAPVTKNTAPTAPMLKVPQKEEKKGK